jgi:hypothetical protein
LLINNCAYAAIFATPIPAEKNPQFIKGVHSAPRPFIIEPDPAQKQDYVKGDLFSFHLILTGKAINYLPYFIFSFMQMALHGFGKGRGKAGLMNGWQLDRNVNEIEIYDGASQLLQPGTEPFNYSGIEKEWVPNIETVDLNFITLTRIKYQGRFISQLTPRILLFSLYNRLNQLNVFHCNGTDDPQRLNTLLSFADNIIIAESEIRWHDWVRYSHR